MDEIKELLHGLNILKRCMSQNAESIEKLSDLGNKIVYSINSIYETMKLLYEKYIDLEEKYHVLNSKLELK